MRSTSATVRSECNFTSLLAESKLPRRKLRIDGDGRLFFEHTNSHISPFPASAVSQVIWRLVKRGGLLITNNGELKVRAVVLCVVNVCE